MTTLAPHLQSIVDQIHAAEPVDGVIRVSAGPEGWPLDETQVRPITAAARPEGAGWSWLLTTHQADRLLAHLGIEGGAS